LEESLPLREKESRRKCCRCEDAGDKSLYGRPLKKGKTFLLGEGEKGGPGTPNTGEGRQTAGKRKSYRKKKVASAKGRFPLFSERKIKANLATVRRTGRKYSVKVHGERVNTSC